MKEVITTQELQYEETESGVLRTNDGSLDYRHFQEKRKDDHKSASGARSPQRLTPQSNDKSSQNEIAPQNPVLSRSIESEKHLCVFWIWGGGGSDGCDLSEATTRGSCELEFFGFCRELKWSWRKRRPLRS